MSQLIDEDLFRMITNPMYLIQSQMEDRRKMLLTICGDKTDEEVIESDKSLAKLKDILDGKSVDVYKTSSQTSSKHLRRK